MKPSYTKNRKVRDSLVIIGLSVLFTTLTIIYIVPWIVPKIKTLTTVHFISIAGVLIAAFTATWQIVQYRIKLTSKAKLQLHVVVDGKNATITSIIKNIGGRRITPQRVYLFVDQGIERDTFFEFPFLLRHEQNEHDCVMAKICKQEKLSYPRDILDKEFKNIYADYIPLKHLSTDSILFIDPEEEFTEDAIVKLPRQGAYRVMLIFTAWDSECVCASREFLVK